MSQNTLKVHDLNEDAEFDENGVEAFDLELSNQVQRFFEVNFIRCFPT